MKHKFLCNTNFIKNVCDGKCCEGNDKILISLLPKEVTWHIQNEFKIKSGFLLPNNVTKKCPHKNKNSCWQIQCWRCHCGQGYEYQQR